MTTVIENGVIVSKTHYSSFSYLRKNRRQSDSLSAATFLLVGNGLNYAINTFTFPYEFTQTFIVLFFIGILIGASVTSITLHKLRKSVHYYISGVFTLLSGILFLATEPSMTMPYSDGYKAANFFSGLAFGIVLLTSIIHSGGVATKYLRGNLFYQLQINIDTGILLFFIIMRLVFLYPNNKLHPNGPIAITLIICSILSFILTFLLCIEAPEFLYETNNNAEALVTMKRLRREKTDTLEILNDLDEIQNYVRKNVSFNENLYPFLKVFMIRFAYILGTSLPLNLIFLARLQMFLSSSFSTLFVNGILYMLIRIFSEFIGFFLIRILGYKKPLIISLFSSGLLLIIINSISIASSESISTTVVDCLGVLILLYQFAIGFGSGSISLLAMSEGFSFNTKTYLNSIIFIIECIIQIIIIYTITITNSSINSYLFVSGFVQLIVAGLAIKFIPETFHKSLKESNELYSK